jgi:small GTP-binding protein
VAVAAEQAVKAAEDEIVSLRAELAVWEAKAASALVEKEAAHAALFNSSQMMDKDRIAASVALETLHADATQMQAHLEARLGFLDEKLTIAEAERVLAEGRGQAAADELCAVRAELEEARLSRKEADTSRDAEINDIRAALHADVERKVAVERTAAAAQREAAVDAVVQAAAIAAAVRGEVLAVEQRRCEAANAAAVAARADQMAALESEQHLQALLSDAEARNDEATDAIASSKQWIAAMEAAQTQATESHAVLAAKEIELMQDELDAAATAARAREVILETKLTALEHRDQAHDAAAAALAAAHAAAEEVIAAESDRIAVLNAQTAEAARVTTDASAAAAAAEEAMAAAATSKQELLLETERVGALKAQANAEALLVAAAAEEVVAASKRELVLETERAAVFKAQATADAEAAAKEAVSAAAASKRELLLETERVVALKAQATLEAEAAAAAAEKALSAAAHSKQELLLETERVAVLKAEAVAAVRIKTEAETATKSAHVAQMAAATAQMAQMTAASKHELFRETERVAALKAQATLDRDYASAAATAAEKAASAAAASTREALLETERVAVFKARANAEALAAEEAASAVAASKRELLIETERVAALKAHAIAEASAASAAAEEAKSAVATSKRELLLETEQVAALNAQATLEAEAATTAAKEAMSAVAASKRELLLETERVAVLKAQAVLAAEAATTAAKEAMSAAAASKRELLLETERVAVLKAEAAEAVRIKTEAEAATKTAQLAHLTAKAEIEALTFANKQQKDSLCRGTATSLHLTPSILLASTPERTTKMNRLAQLKAKHAHRRQSLADGVAPSIIHTHATHTTNSTAALLPPTTPTTTVSNAQPMQVDTASRNPPAADDIDEGNAADCSFNADRSQSVHPVGNTAADDGVDDDGAVDVPIPAESAHTPPLSTPVLTPPAPPVDPNPEETARIMSLLDASLDIGSTGCATPVRPPSYTAIETILVHAFGAEAVELRKHQVSARLRNAWLVYAFSALGRAESKVAMSGAPSGVEDVVKTVAVENDDVKTSGGNAADSSFLVNTSLFNADANDEALMLLARDFTSSVGTLSGATTEREHEAKQQQSARLDQLQRASAARRETRQRTEAENPTTEVVSRSFNGEDDYGDTDGEELEEEDEAEEAEGDGDEHDDGKGSETAASFGTGSSISFSEWMKKAKSDGQLVAPVKNQSNLPNPLIPQQSIKEVPKPKLKKAKKKKHVPKRMAPPPRTISRVISVALVGECNVGKSAIVARFVADTFNGRILPTSGADLTGHERVVKANARLSGTRPALVKFQIRDTSGATRDQVLGGIYSRDANVVLVVADLTKPETVAAAIARYEAKRGAWSEQVVVLVGNKADLAAKWDPTNVVDNELAEFALENGLGYHRVSAKERRGVHRLFDTVATHLLFGGVLTGNSVEQPTSSTADEKDDGPLLDDSGLVVSPMKSEHATGVDGADWMIPSW